MRSNHVGYISKSTCNGIINFEIFKNKDRTFAVEVCRKPMMIPTYQDGKILNAKTLETYSEIREVDKPFELRPHRGSYGYWIFVNNKKKFLTKLRPDDLMHIQDNCPMNDYNTWSDYRNRKPLASAMGMKISKVLKY